MHRKELDTISAFENDVQLQLDYLEKFVPQKQTQKNAIFCGSGDSLCAAMLAEAFSNYNAKSCDPLELAKNPKMALGKSVYFVSISGNTISNIKAAQLVRAGISITRNPKSKLARACKNIILLDYADSGILTAGTVGFLASALTCISLVYDLKISGAKNLYESAKRHSGKVVMRNKVYFLGNQHTFPIAMYASAKLGEVLGMDSKYERIEQFSHMGLFTAKKGDTVIILEPKNKHNSSLKSNLKKLGLDVYVFDGPSDKTKQVLFYMFLVQFLALGLARKRNLGDCYFIVQKKTRAASSDMIY